MIALVLLVVCWLISGVLTFALEGYLPLPLLPFALVAGPIGLSFSLLIALLIAGLDSEPT